MNELHQTVGRIEAKVDVLLGIEKRVGSVEKRQWVVLAAAVVAGGLMLPAKYHSLMAAFAL